jgi:hypothetical protein
MGHIEKRDGRFRARYRDPLGRHRCKTFTRKADAERFLREQETVVTCPSAYRPGQRIVPCRFPQG